MRRLLTTTSECILEALLDGELHNRMLAKRVGITQQHLSRLLHKLNEHHLIHRRQHGSRRINSLTSFGMSLAENARERLHLIDGIRKQTSVNR